MIRPIAAAAVLAFLPAPSAAWEITHGKSPLDDTQTVEAVAAAEINNDRISLSCIEGRTILAFTLATKTAAPAFTLRADDRRPQTRFATDDDVMRFINYSRGAKSLYVRVGEPPLHYETRFRLDTFADAVEAVRRSCRW
jgi:hypothetical protein